MEQNKPQMTDKTKQNLLQQSAYSEKIQKFLTLLHQNNLLSTAWTLHDSLNIEIAEGETEEIARILREAGLLTETTGLLLGQKEKSSRPEPITVTPPGSSVNLLG